MQLEQSFGMYQPMQMQITRGGERVYTIVNLEYLSASVLYTGDLTIRPLGETQIHMHEGAGGAANIKYKDGTGTPISSYDAAMMDLLLDRANMPKIQTTDKGERRGRT
jgi:hypothetical protein